MSNIYQYPSFYLSFSKTVSGLAYYVKSNGIIQDPTSILKPPESDFDAGIVKTNTIKVKRNTEVKTLAC